MDTEDARMIGALDRMICRRRGLSLDVAAGFVGVITSYLSMLERGQHGLGLLEDLASALRYSAADLTGQPYLESRRWRHSGDLAGAQ